MNLTEEQKTLLRTIVDVYNKGHSPQFIVVPSLSGRTLVYNNDEPNIPTDADETDFQQLATENLITLNDNSQGLLLGKPTDLGIKVVDTNFATHSPAPTIFIGHGQSTVWKDLKEFLHDRLHLKWEEFIRESPAGVSTKERLEEMLENATFAFLVMTADDEHPDGTSHARENVVHEVGLFQGRLGFKRAIIVLEKGCAQFSNIHGLTHIDFPPGNIKAAFEDIRMVLEREGVISSETRRVPTTHDASPRTARKEQEAMALTERQKELLSWLVAGGRDQEFTQWLEGGVDGAPILIQGKGEDERKDEHPKWERSDFQELAEKKLIELTQNRPHFVQGKVIEAGIELVSSGL